MYILSFDYLESLLGARSGIVYMAYVYSLVNINNIHDTFMPALSWVVASTEAEGHRELA
jgi:hypothetical protein